MDCGAPPGAGGSDRGNRVPARDEQRGRKGEGDVHPVVVTKPEGYVRRTGLDRYRRGASRPGGNLPDTLGEISGGKETGHDCHSLPAERQGVHGLVRQPDHLVDCRGIHRTRVVVIL